MAITVYTPAATTGQLITSPPNSFLQVLTDTSTYGNINVGIRKNSSEVGYDFFGTYDTNNRSLSMSLPAFSAGDVLTVYFESDDTGNVLGSYTLTASSAQTAGNISISIATFNAKFDGGEVVSECYIYFGGTSSGHQPPMITQIDLPWVDAPVVTVPTAPTKLVVTPSNASISATWAAPSNTGGTPITRYEVSLDGTNWTSVNLSTSHTFSGLVNGTSYTVRVRAVNSVGAGQSANATAIPVTTPGAPTNLQTTVGDSEINATWSAPTNNGGSSILRYEVSLNGGTWASVGLTTSHAFSGLTNGTEYTIGVRAVNAVGIGSVETTTAIPLTTPSAPDNLAAVAGDSQISLSWNTPSSDGGTEIVRYEVSIDGSTWASVGLDTSHLFTGLQNGTVYTSRVRAVNGVGAGQVASAVATPVEATTPPSPPVSLSADAADSAAFMFWSAPDSDGGDPILHYEVSKNNGGSWIDVGLVFSHGFFNLVNGTEYKVGVRAVNVVGASAGVFVSVTPIADAAPPSEPTNVVAISGDTQVQVTWAAPLDNGGSEITGYEVSQDGIWIGVGLTLTHTFTELVNDTEYTFGVRAVNEVGEGAKQFISATPHSDTPPPRPAVVPYFGMFSRRLRGGLCWGEFIPVSRTGALGTKTGDPVEVAVIIDEGGSENWQKVEAEHDSDILVYAPTKLGDGSPSPLAKRNCVGGWITLVGESEDVRKFKVEGWDVAKNQRTGIVDHYELTCSEQI